MKEALEEVDTELGEIGEAVQKALDRTFQEEYEVGDVRITKADRISVIIKLIPDED